VLEDINAEHSDENESDEIVEVHGRIGLGRIAIEIIESNRPIKIFSDRTGDFQVRKHDPKALPYAENLLPRESNVPVVVDGIEALIDEGQYGPDVCPEEQIKNDFDQRGGVSCERMRQLSRIE